MQPAALQPGAQPAASPARGGRVLTSDQQQQLDDEMSELQRLLEALDFAAPLPPLQPRRSARGAGRHAAQIQQQQLAPPSAQSPPPLPARPGSAPATPVRRSRVPPRLLLPAAAALSAPVSPSQSLLLLDAALPSATPAAAARGHSDDGARLALDATPQLLPALLAKSASAGALPTALNPGGRLPGSFQGRRLSACSVNGGSSQSLGDPSLAPLLAGDDDSSSTGSIWDWQQPAPARRGVQQTPPQPPHAEPQPARRQEREPRLSGQPQRHASAPPEAGSSGAGGVGRGGGELWRLVDAAWQTKGWL